MTTSPFHAITAVLAVSATLLSSCGKKADPVTEAAAEEKKQGLPAPSIEEVKQIAKEDFIHGLPLVMAYTASYEFWVDKSSSQYKGPFNEIYNERRVFTPKDTAAITPNSDTPCSLACLDVNHRPSCRRAGAVGTRRP